MKRIVTYTIKPIYKRNKTVLNIYVHHKGRKIIMWQGINPNKLLSLFGINFSGRGIILYKKEK